MNEWKNYNKMYVSDKDEPVETEAPAVDLEGQLVIKGAEVVDDTTPVIEEPAVEESEKTIGVVNYTRLNVRENPDRTAAVLGVLSKGAEVQIIEEANDGWVYICTAIGLDGFCMKQYIDIKE